MPVVRVSGTHPQNLYKPKCLGDVGYDLALREGGKIDPGEHVFLKTGVRLGMAQHYWAEITGRSSSIVHYGLLVVRNIIDTGYRGELTVGLMNVGRKSQTVRPGDKLAQLIFHIAHTCPIVVVEDLEMTERGENGFGSTGLRHGDSTHRTRVASAALGMSDVPDQPHVRQT